jgi:hypothetical protein
VDGKEEFQEVDGRIALISQMSLAMTVGRTAQWQFGFDLVYTMFDYSKLALQEVDDLDDSTSLSVRVKTKTGIYTGHEVVQAFVSPGSVKGWRPARELKGYVKVWLLPGEAKTVDLSESWTVEMEVDGKPEWVPTCPTRSLLPLFFHFTCTSSPRSTSAHHAAHKTATHLDE